MTATVSPFGSDGSLPACALYSEYRGGPRPPTRWAGMPARHPFSLTYIITSKALQSFLGTSRLLSGACEQVPAEVLCG